MDKYELREYRSIVQQIKQLQQEREENIQLVKPQDGQPHGSGIGDPTFYACAENLKITKEIEKLIAEKEKKREKIQKALYGLSVRDYNIIHSYYFLGKKWEDVAAELNYSESHILKLHGNILQKLKDDSK